MPLARTLGVLFLSGVLVSAQDAASPLASTIAREIASGETHEYTVPAAAGELFAGAVHVRGLAAVVDVRDTADRSVTSFYLMEPSGTTQERAIGFVAPASGAYRVRLRAYDRFDSGPQTAPGAPIAVAGKARGSYVLRLAGKPVAERMRGFEISTRTSNESARLRKLSVDIEQGRTQSLDDFWREMAGKGPLLEAVPGNDSEIDVTFLWRERYETHNVLVSWAMSFARPDDYSMSRLPKTDVWYKTLRLQRGSRFSYLLSPNDRADDRNWTAVIDPLNPRIFPDDPTYPFSVSSVLDTPGAPDETWVRNTPARRGKIDERKYVSTLLKNERDIWIYTPPDYTPSGGPYPFVLLFDGAAYVSSRWLNAPATLDNLIGAGRIRPAIVCFIPAVNRGVEQGFSGADVYGDAIVRELLPMMRTSYSITSGPREIVIGGFSNGGLAASLIAFRHPEVFGNVLSQSGAFRQRRPDSPEPNLLAQMYLSRQRLPIRFYLETGRYDNVPNAGLPLHEMVLDETNTQGNRHFRDVLLAKGYDVTYREVGGQHEELHWRAMLADGLMTLLPPAGRQAGSR